MKYQTEVEDIFIICELPRHTLLGNAKLDSASFTQTCNQISHLSTVNPQLYDMISPTVESINVGTVFTFPHFQSFSKHSLGFSFRFLGHARKK